MLQSDIERFKTANFVPAIAWLFKKSKVFNLSVEALFYFFSNQPEKISAQHIESVNALYSLSRGNISVFMATATVLNAMEAIESKQLNVNKTRLAQLAAECFDEHFASRLLEIAVNNHLNLTSPFSDNKAYCQESYNVGVMTCLRFTDEHQCFFLIQDCSSADSLYFPNDNILIYLAHARARNVKDLQFKLISNFCKVIEYAKSTNNFAGLIASNHRPSHFYYELLPALVSAYQKPDIWAKIPCLIARKNHDFNDFKLLFPECTALVLDADSIENKALSERKWFVCISNNPHQRRNYQSYQAIDHYLINQATKTPSDSAIAKATLIKDCYPLVLICVEGQKRCWLEQVAGYIYILNNLSKRYPALGVVIDGWTMPFTPSEKSFKDVKKDSKIAEKIISQLNANTTCVSVIGENSNSKIFITQKIDFFICSFATGSLYASRMLAKPGFCHLSNAHSEHTLHANRQIHSNRQVYLLPRKYITDRQVSVSYLQTIQRFFLTVLAFLSGNKKIKTIELGKISYSIDKKLFFQFIEQRLDKILNPAPQKLRFFLEPSFSIHPDVRHYLNMASYGKILNVFPTLTFPKQLSDLTDFTENYLQQQIIYGVFAFGGHAILHQPSEYLIWLGDPLKRVQLHILQFAKNAVCENCPADITTILAAKHKDLDNYYTRLISGIDVPFGHCTEEMLNMAIVNLSQHFVFIGINDQQTRSFDRLCTLMDWDRSLFPNQLPNQFDIGDNDFSDYNELLENALICYDLRLYKAALTITSIQQE